MAISEGIHLSHLKPRKLMRDDTAFDRMVCALGLEGKPEFWPVSLSLEQWARRHADTHYVPEYLLSHWRIHVREHMTANDR